MRIVPRKLIETEAWIVDAFRAPDGSVCIVTEAKGNEAKQTIVALNRTQGLDLGLAIVRASGMRMEAWRQLEQEIKARNFGEGS